MKTLHTIYMNFAKRFAIVLFFLTTLGLSSAWAATGTLNTINSQTGTDSQGNTWTVNVVGTNSFTDHGSYFQIGSSSYPATSITLTMTLPEEQLITSFNAAFSGYSGATGTVTLKVGSTTVGTGAITASHTTSSPITISSTQQKAGTVLTVTVTGIMKGGINFHNLSYTYVSTTTHQVTWVSADATQNLDISQGMLDVNQMPNDPENCSNGAVFVGWTEQSTVTGERPTDLFNRNTLNDLPNISGPTTFTAVYAIQTEEPGPKTDVLDKATTGNPSSYTDWTASSATSSAAYAGNSSGSNNSIQLRDNTSSGIVTTTSGGKAKKITVSWESHTTSGRVLNIYGKNTKYESSADLYDDSKKGVLLGTIVYGTSTELTISDDYKYIGLCSNNGAMYLTSVSIEWYFEGSYTDYTTSCSSDVTVTLNPNGGTGGDFTDWFLDGSKYTQTVEKGNSVTLPTLDDQIAYTFGGWSDGNAVIPAGDYTPEKDIELTAVWTARPLTNYRTSCTYTVTWQANGGLWNDGKTEDIVDEYNIGAAIIKPTDPTSEGYRFLGWSEDGATIVAPKTTMPAENLTYIAVWEEEYSVTYNPNGGNTMCVDNNAYIKGEIVTVCATQPTKTGYTFAGWNDGTNTYQAGNTFRMPAGDVTLTAQWTANTNTAYKVEHYQQNVDGTYPTTPYETDALTGTTDATVTPSVKIYEGFTSPATQTIPILADGSSVVRYEYTRNSYTLTWDLNGGNETAAGTAAGSVKYGALLTAPKMERVGYTFVGWDPAVPATMPATDVTYTAIWENCRWVETDIKQIDPTEEVVVAMKKKGHVYALDYSNGTGGYPPAREVTVSGTEITSTISDKIKWNISGNATDGYILYPNGDNTRWLYCTKSNNTVRVGENTTDNRFTIDNGYLKHTNTAEAWQGYVGVSFNTSPYSWRHYPSSDNSVINGQTLKFYTRLCLEDNQHWINYQLSNVNCTSSPVPVYVTEGDANLNLMFAAEEGFTLPATVAVTMDGNPIKFTWEDGKLNIPAPPTGFNADVTITITAVHTVTFDMQGHGTQVAPQTVAHQAKATQPTPAPTAAGYTFGGWYKDNACTKAYDFATPVEENITLYAKWTFAMEYNITNTETIYITSAKKQTVKATTQLTLQVGNMPVGTTIDIAAPHITFYDDAGKAVTQLTTKYNPETFSLAVAYTPEDEKTTEQPTITLSVLGYEKAFDIISARSLPATFAIVAKVGSMWYALPSQGLSSSNDLIGYPVEVDNQDDPTFVAYVPENADWSLRQVYKSTGTDDRFGANGDNILFVNGEDNALNASRTEGYVLTEAGYGGYQTTTSPDLYEWTPTTTDLETYQVNNAYRTDRKLSIDILTRFGIYKGEIENLRFLPIQGRYTQATFQVVEWKENSVVIMYNGNPDQQATLAINGVKVGSAQLRAAEKDFAVYELPANGLVNQPTQRLLITIGSEQKWLTIPYIISGEKTDEEVVAATSAEIATATDVFILKDAKFTATATSKNSQYRFRNVTVYGGGKLVIGSGKFLSMNSIILRAGGITAAGEYDYVYPQFDLQGTLTNSAGEFKYDYITDYEHWFHLVLPFDGTIKSPSIKYPVEFYGNNVSATNSGSWVVKRYDGATRATGNYEAWVDIESENADVITAGHGYIYWGAPKKVKVNGEEKRQKWGIQRIVMKKGWEAARDAEIGNKTVSGLGSYANVDNNSGNVYDQGWNLIGNPYMVNLTGLNSKSLKTGKLIEERDANGNWTGGWVLDSINATLRYITVPSDHFEWYTAEKVSKNMELSTGRTFFVQIDGTATDVMFEAANRAQLMPALLAENNNNPVDIETGIILSNETLQDEVNFWIKDGKTNDYEYNADYPKTPNTNNFNIYGVHTNGHLSWVAISPEIAAESMPIGYQVPAAGTYTLSVSETYYSDDLQALYVTDHAMSPELTVDLMNAPYEFSVNQAETNNERFTISLILKSENQGPTTDLENIGVMGDKPMKFIYQDKIFILHHGVIYDATGKQVTTINK